LEMLLQMRAQASGAIDTVLSLLEDLRKASINEKTDLEARNKTQEADGSKMISELTQILSMNEKNYQEALAHRKFIETEIEDTENHIIWIEKRLVEIARKLAELKVQRCHANALFVDALKEHNDALKAIKVLEMEISKRHAAGELTEIGSLTQKFQAYGHLFKEESVNAFLDLAKVDDITGQVDNTRGELKLQGMKTNPGQRNLSGTLADKVLAMLKDLTQHLKDSMKDLEKHEIQAAYDYADFKASSEIENVTLRQDHGRKEKYLANLEIDVEVARENEDRTLVLRDESQISLDSSVEDLNIKRAFYAQEMARVKEDLSTVDQVIETFRSKIMTLQKELSNRIDEYQAGDQMSHISRKAEVMGDKLSGKLGKKKSKKSRKPKTK